MDQYDLAANKAPTIAPFFIITAINALQSGWEAENNEIIFANRTILEVYTNCAPSRMSIKRR